MNDQYFWAYYIHQNPHYPEIICVAAGTHPDYAVLRFGSENMYRLSDFHILSLPLEVPKNEQTS